MANPKEGADGVGKWGTVSHGGGMRIEWRCGGGRCGGEHGVWKERHRLAPVIAEAGAADGIGVREEGGR